MLGYNSIAIKLSKPLAETQKDSFQKALISTLCIEFGWLPQDILALAYFDYQHLLIILPERAANQVMNSIESVSVGNQIVAYFSRNSSVLTPIVSIKLRNNSVAMIDIERDLEEKISTVIGNGFLPSNIQIYRSSTNEETKVLECILTLDSVEKAANAVAVLNEKLLSGITSNSLAVGLQIDCSARQVTFNELSLSIVPCVASSTSTGELGSGNDSGKDVVEELKEILFSCAHFSAHLITELLVKINSNRAEVVEDSPLSTASSGTDIAVIVVMYHPFSASPDKLGGLLPIGGVDAQLSRLRFADSRRIQWVNVRGSVRLPSLPLVPHLSTAIVSGGSSQVLLSARSAFKARPDIVFAVLILWDFKSVGVTDLALIEKLDSGLKLMAQAIVSPGEAASQPIISFQKWVLVQTEEPIATPITSEVMVSLCDAGFSVALSSNDLGSPEGGRELNALMANARAKIPIAASQLVFYIGDDKRVSSSNCFERLRTVTKSVSDQARLFTISSNPVYPSLQKIRSSRLDETSDDDTPQVTPRPERCFNLQDVCRLSDMTPDEQAQLISGGSSSASSSTKDGSGSSRREPFEALIQVDQMNAADDGFFRVDQDSLGSHTDESHDNCDHVETGSNDDGILSVLSANSSYDFADNASSVPTVVAATPEIHDFDDIQIRSSDNLPGSTASDRNSKDNRRASDVPVLLGLQQRSRLTAASPLWEARDDLINHSFPVAAQKPTNDSMEENLGLSLGQNFGLDLGLGFGKSSSAGLGLESSFGLLPKTTGFNSNSFGLGFSKSLIGDENSYGLVGQRHDMIRPSNTSSVTGSAEISPTSTSSSMQRGFRSSTNSGLSSILHSGIATDVDSSALPQDFLGSFSHVNKSHEISAFQYPQTESSSGIPECILDLASQEIANHIRNLMVWGERQARADAAMQASVAHNGFAGNISQIRVQTTPTGVVEITSASLLLGEIGSKAELEITSSSVVLVLDSTQNRFQLVISGDSFDIVERRRRRVEPMLIAITRESASHMLTGWTDAHAECISHSMILLEIQHEHQSTACFFRSDEVICVEIITASPRRHASLLQAITALIPISAVWHVPLAKLMRHLEPQGRKLLKHRHAVVLDNELLGESIEQPRFSSHNHAFEIQGPQVVIGSIQVWGFADMLDAALGEVLGTRDAIKLHAACSNIQSYGAHQLIVSDDNRSVSSIGSSNSGGSSLRRHQLSSQLRPMQSQLFQRHGIDSSPIHGIRQQIGMPQPPSTAFTGSVLANQISVSSAARQNVALLPSLSGAIGLRTGFNALAQVSDSSVRSTQGDSVVWSTTITHREPLLFYHAFEADFRAYVKQKFNVHMHEITASADANPQMSIQPTPVKVHPASLMAPYRLMYSGANIRDVQACGQYLEQLNTQELLKDAVQYGKMDGTRYKILYSQKVKLDTLFRTVRSKTTTPEAQIAIRNDIQSLIDNPDAISLYVNMPSSRADLILGDELMSRSDTPELEGYFDKVENESTMVSTSNSDTTFPDPLATTGFLHIHMKPALHSRGIRRMALPADVTVCVCAPRVSSEQESIFRSVLRSFDKQAMDEFGAAMDVPNRSPIATVLGTRQYRDEFIDLHSITALRYDDAVRRRSQYGRAVIWCSSLEHLTYVVGIMGRQGALNASMLPSSTRQASYQHAPSTVTQTQSYIQSVNRNAFDNCSEDSGSSTWTPGRPPLPPVPHSASGAQGHGQQANSSLSSTTAATAPANTSKLSKVMLNANADKAIIRWPHTSFRFMFLGEFLKKLMNELLADLRVRLKIHTVCPFRDKTDPLACLLLEDAAPTEETMAGPSGHASEGPKSLSVAQAAREVNLFMSAVHAAMSCISVVVSDTQLKVLMKQDLIKVKEIQGKCGVHIVLDCLPHEPQSSLSKLDLRVPSSRDGLPSIDITAIEVGSVCRGTKTIAETLGLHNFVKKTGDGNDLSLPPGLGSNGGGSGDVSSGYQDEITLLSWLKPCLPLDQLAVLVRRADATRAVVLTSHNSNMLTTYASQAELFFPALQLYHVLMLVDPFAADSGLTSLEQEKLIRGEVLIDHIDSELSSSQVLFRVRPEIATMSNEAIRAGLQQAIHRGLNAVDALGLDNCTIVVPTEHSLLTGMAVTDLSRAVVNAAILFIRNTPVLRSIQKISVSNQVVLVSKAPFPSKLHPSLFARNSTPPRMDLIYDRNKLAPATSCILSLELLNAFIESLAVTSVPSVNQNSKPNVRIKPDAERTMDLLFCNMALPCDVPVEALLLAANGYSYRTGTVPSGALIASQSSKLSASGHKKPIQQQGKPAAAAAAILMSPGGTPHPAVINRLVADVIPTMRSENEPSTTIIVRGMTSGVFIAGAYLRKAAQL